MIKPSIDWSDIYIGMKIKEKETGINYKIMSMTGYFNYDLGVERLDIDDPDTEYIRSLTLRELYEIL